MARGKKKGGGGDDVFAVPAWMVTYGDFMTLLLTFFVMLFAMSTLSPMKFTKVLIAMEGAIGESGTLDGERRPMLPLNMGELEMQKMLDVMGELQVMVDRLGLEKRISMHHDERGLLVRLSADGLFERGSDEFVREGLVALDAVGQHARLVSNEIEIQGHTDDIRVVSPEFRTNMHLSVARAESVYEYLAEEDYVAPRRMRCTGYGAHRPAVAVHRPDDAENYPDEGQREDVIAQRRARNRRIEVLFLRSDVNAPVDIYAPYE